MKHGRSELPARRAKATRKHPKLEGGGTLWVTGKPSGEIAQRLGG